MRVQRLAQSCDILPGFLDDPPCCGRQRAMGEGMNHDADGLQWQVGWQRLEAPLFELFVNSKWRCQQKRIACFGQAGERAKTLDCVVHSMPQDEIRIGMAE